MQTFSRLTASSSLRAVSPGAQPPADGVPRPMRASDQEALPALRSAAGTRHWRLSKLLPHPPRPTWAVGSPAAEPARLACGNRAGLRAGMRHRSCDNLRSLEEAGSVAPLAFQDRRGARGAWSHSAQPVGYGTYGVGQGARGNGSAPHPARSGPPSLPPGGRRAGRTGLPEARVADGVGRASAGAVSPPAGRRATGAV